VATNPSIERSKDPLVELVEYTFTFPTKSLQTMSTNTSMNRSTGKNAAPSTDALRNFYFSGATNYSAYKTKAEKSTALDLSGSGSNSPNQNDAALAGSAQTAALSSAAATHTNSAVLQPSTAAGSAAKFVKSAAAGGSGSAAALQSSTQRPASRGVGTASGDAVSPEYINFLRQQQDLVKSHNAIVEALKSMMSVAAAHKGDHTHANGDALDLLHEAEQSTDWHWKSKFDLPALVRDAELEVPHNELLAPDALPRVADLQHQHQLAVKLRQDHPQAQHFSLVLENGVRRIERLIKEFSDSQLDAERVTRLSDTLMVQLDHVMSAKPLRQVLQSTDDQIAVIENKRRQCQATRDQALEDGAMDVAERESYRLADLFEELVGAQLERIRLLNAVAQDHAVTMQVRDDYATRAADETSQLTGETTDLRTRCEDDLAKVYKLVRLAEETEDQQSTRWASDRAASDARISTINRRQTEAWEQIELLVKQLGALEDERHQECKRRIEEKVKDETRRNEYTVFRKVADAHAATLDRTIKNCDINIHCAKLMHEFVNTGFNTIQRYITEIKTESDSELLSAQKTHLDMFRGLLFTLGDLDYKKGKRIDEVAENIQAAHIQQELCSDSLNPNAKKFSDAKRELLRVRDELSQELNDLKERQRIAAEQFEPTETALVRANVEHVHPTEELEDRRLNTRAKMVEYRAMSLGHVSSAPLESEIETLRKTFNESRRLTQRSRGSANSTMMGPL
jgi:hypothetical protein